MSVAHVSGAIFLQGFRQLLRLLALDWLPRLATLFSFARLTSNGLENTKTFNKERWSSNCAFALKIMSTPRVLPQQQGGYLVHRSIDRSKAQLRRYIPSIHPRKLNNNVFKIIHKGSVHLWAPPEGEKRKYELYTLNLKKWY